MDGIDRDLKTADPVCETIYEFDEIRSEAYDIDVLPGDLNGAV